ncbi:MAG: ferredoxin [Candidatus Nanoarchaeia archaeon]|jgi:ferredoxin
MAYEVKHERAKCIGCQSCALECPDYWAMESDGLSRLKGAKPGKKGWEQRVFNTDEGLACNQRAANVCPVKIIHVDKK